MGRVLAILFFIATRSRNTIKIPIKIKLFFTVDLELITVSARCRQFQLGEEEIFQ